MTRARSKRSERSVWWLVPAGLALAAWVVWSLLTAQSGHEEQDRGKDAPASEISDESREALRDILREADGREADGEEAD